jgi:hypothetical protein
MSRHDDAVRLRHMLDAARKAVSLVAGGLGPRSRPTSWHSLRWPGSSRSSARRPARSRPTTRRRTRRSPGSRWEASATGSPTPTSTWTSTSFWTSWRRTSRPSSGNWKAFFRTCPGSFRFHQVSKPQGDPPQRLPSVATASRLSVTWLPPTRSLGLPTSSGSLIVDLASCTLTDQRKPRHRDDGDGAMLVTPKGLEPSKD